MISQFRIKLDEWFGIKTPDGEFKKYYWGKNVAIHSSFLNGCLHGPYTRYYAHGEKKEEFTYDNGEMVGGFIKYHPSGRIKIKGTLLRCANENWEKYYDEDFTEYYDIDNRILSQRHYNKGVKVGKHIRKNEDGTLRREENYNENGELHGVNKTLHGDVISDLSNYYEGHRHGESFNMYYGGGLHKKYIHEMGLLCEYWEYDKSGKLIKHKKFNPPLKEESYGLGYGARNY